MNPIVRGAGVLRLTLLPVMSSNPLCLWGSTTFRRSAEGRGKEIKLCYIGSLLIESQAIGLSPRAPGADSTARYSAGDGGHHFGG